MDAERQTAEERKKAGPRDANPRDKDSLEGAGFFDERRAARRVA